MEWTTEYINDLPDSAFAYIEPGGQKDDSGKTVPRSLRHFPMHDKDGKLDEAHVRNAMARMMQSPHGEKAKKAIMAAAKKLGMGEMKESVQDLVESATFSGKVDRAQKIIHGVAVLGKTSLNTNQAGKARRYSDSALSEGKEYFEGAPVYLEHEEKKRTRDLVGELRNLHLDGDRLRADMPVTETHSWVLDVADRFPNQIGLSIKATGRVRETADGDVVEGFAQGRRRSVDLVTDPATVKNLFESKEENKVTLEELQEHVKALTADRDKIAAENAQMKKKLEESTKAPPASVAKPEAKDIAQVVQLEHVVELEKKIEEQTKQLQEMQLREKKAQHDALVEKMLAENKVTASPTFRALLEKCEKPEELKAAIEDRKRVASSAIRSIGISEKAEHPAKEKEALEKQVLEALRG